MIIDYTFELLECMVLMLSSKMRPVKGFVSLFFPFSFFLFPTRKRPLIDQPLATLPLHGTALLSHCTLSLTSLPASHHTAAHLRSSTRSSSSSSRPGRRKAGRSRRRSSSSPAAAAQRTSPQPTRRRHEQPKQAKGHGRHETVRGRIHQTQECSFEWRAKAREDGQQLGEGGTRRLTRASAVCLSPVTAAA